MNTMLLGLLAETAIHPGAGQSTGFVDLPVAREAATDYPVIVGSSLKGAMRERARQEIGDESTREDIFGRQDSAGGVLFSDARLLLLPVRSLNGAYRWVTCPHLLERFGRDRMRAGMAGEALSLTHAVQLGEAKALTNKMGETLFLEERQFTSVADVDTEIVKAIEPLMESEAARARLMKQIVVLSDDDFSWFARYGLGVVARNVLEADTKESKNLWYEESLPADSLFYTVLYERNAGTLEPFGQLLEERPYVRMGGNETIGQGWFAVTITRQGGQ